MKQKTLQKRVAIESVGILVTLTVFGSVLYFLTDTLETMQTEEKSLEVEIAKITTEKNALQTQYNNTKENADLYREASARNPEDGNFANKQILQDKFNQYQPRFLMNGLRLTMTPKHDLTEPQYKRAKMIVAASELSLTFDTLLDDNIYAMLNAMQRDLPGVQKITSVKLTRAEPVTEKVLEAVVRQGTYPLVKSEIKLVLLGIKPIETTTKPVAHAP